MLASDAVVTETIAAYRAAVLARDVEALLALYSPRVRVYDLWGPWSADGEHARRESVQEWFGTLGAESVHVQAADVRAQLGEDLAVVEAFLRFEARDPAGAVLRWMTNRLTWVLVPDTADRWRIVHEHISAPIDPGSGTAVLQR
ncbi:MAG TPA: nuclear transport factor 2 family protein [Cellulomonas sp.]